MTPTPLEEIEWSDAFVPPAPLGALEAEAKKRLGRVPEMLPFTAHAPWVARLAMELSAAKPAHLDPLLVGRLFVVVAQEHSCRHCYGAARSMMRLFGYAPEDIRELEAEVQSASLPPKVRAALDFGRRLSRSTPRPPVEIFAPLKSAGFTGPEVVELTAAVLLLGAGARMATSLAMEPSAIEAFERRWFVRLFRPLIRSMFRRMMMQRGPVTSLPADILARPLGRLVTPYDGTAYAELMVGAAAAPFLPSSLSPRSKALIGAVIGRALGCGATEAVFCAELERAGLATREIQDALAHLHSAALTPAELAVLAYARETVRYKPVDLQRRTRALFAVLGPEQTIETIFIAAVLNMIARGTVLLELQ